MTASSRALLLAAALLLCSGVQARRARGVDGAGLKFVRRLGKHRALARDGLDHLAAR